MAPATRRYSALLFLLAFALGGIALPAAHQVDHFLEGAQAPLHHEASLLPTNYGSQHDCSLCDVKLTAEDAQHSSASLVSVTTEPAAIPHEWMLKVSVRMFDGRAPPYLS